MSSIDRMKSQMSALERALAGLPGVQGYKEKELRRAADRQVREALVQLLEDQRSRITALQLDLVQSGRLEWVDDLERAIGKLQLLMDQAKTAAYGYAGFFDADKVREAELEALAQFDQEMIRRAGELQERISSIAQAMSSQEDLGQAMRDLINLLADLNQQWRHRSEAMHRAVE
ncbi:MAG: hypothetical protein RML36_03570 [Anaerolineae bacterium]|nr:hypothetical protein [Anaerolineae bacterium]MDW8098548.1 hypothetical protein [Anaerolineae bacterium]